MSQPLPADKARKLLAGIRLANGAAALLTPRWLARRLDLDPAGGDIYLLRLFGVRTVLIGVELLDQDPELRARAVDAAVFVHASDAMAAAIAGITGQLSRRAALAATAISSLNVALSLLARSAEPS